MTVLVRAPPSPSDFIHSLHHLKNWEKKLELIGCTFFYRTRKKDCMYGILYLIQHYISTKATFFFIFYYIIKEHVIEWLKNILKGKKNSFLKRRKKVAQNIAVYSLLINQIVIEGVHNTKYIYSTTNIFESGTNFRFSWKLNSFLRQFYKVKLHPTIASSD